MSDAEKSPKVTPLFGDGRLHLAAARNRLARLEALELGLPEVTVGQNMGAPVNLAAWRAMREAGLSSEFDEGAKTPGD